MNYLPILHVSGSASAATALLSSISVTIVAVSAPLVEKGEGEYADFIIELFGVRITKLMIIIAGTISSSFVAAHA